jgi:L-arabinose isomerase
MLQIKVRPKIGLLTTGHKMYWGQFPSLKEMGSKMTDKLLQHLNEIGDVITSGLVDTYERAVEAGELFKKTAPDFILVFPLGYTTGMMIAPVFKMNDCPVRILNAHEDSSYDYANADTATYLHHEGPCCIPEYSVTLATLDKNFKVISGHFEMESMWAEIKREAHGIATAREFKNLHYGVLGNTYTNMTDMPTDEHRILSSTGKLLKRPEIEEIEEAYKRVTPDQLEEMYQEFRSMYDVDDSVTNEHLTESAKIAIAFDEVIRKHNISAFGYYWWGEKGNITHLRSESALAVSRLAALGIPGVTEGDVKTAMAMKILDLLGGGGMFLEFFSLDFDENFIMVGHDGPSNINVAKGKPRLQHLEVHHGKTGHGLGIDFNMAKGPCTLLSLTQFRTKTPFKLIYSVGSVIDGDILNIGNPNCRVEVKKPIAEFFNDWCQEAPPHHMALGIGDFSMEIEAFAEKIGFECRRI